MYSMYGETNRRKSVHGKPRAAKMMRRCSSRKQLFVSRKHKERNQYTLASARIDPIRYVPNTGIGYCQYHNTHRIGYWQYISIYWATAGADAGTAVGAGALRFLRRFSRLTRAHISISSMSSFMP